MVSYDPKVIADFAEQLYRRAAFIAVKYTLLGAAVGGIVGAAAGARSEHALLLAVVVGLVCAGVGLILGASRGFMLRLQAQQALCQLQIEANTRAAAEKAATRAA